MDTDRAKCREASATADILLFDAESYGRSALSLEQAQELVKLTKERYAVGLVNRIDVSRAEYRLVVAELRASKIDHAGYCVSALPVLQKVASDLKERMDGGVGSVTEVLAAMRQLAATGSRMQGREAAMRNRIARPALSAAIMLATVATAQAYSDEAVRGAEEIVRSTQARFQVGEVERSDLALATYNVLDMRLKAGKLDAVAFCKAAKPQLEAVAAGFQPDDGQADAKKAWLDAIAGMDGDPAKCRDASTATERLMFGVTPADYSDAGLNKARTAVIETATRAADGEATAADVSAARYALIDIKHGTKAMTQAAYCQTGVPLLQQIADGIVEEARVGQRSLAEVIAADRTLAAAAAQCMGALPGDIKAVDVAHARARRKPHAKKELDAAIADYDELLRRAAEHDRAPRPRRRLRAKRDNAHAEADYSAALALDATDIDTPGRVAICASARAIPTAASPTIMPCRARPRRSRGHIPRAPACCSASKTMPARSATVAIDRAPPKDPFYLLGPLKDALEHRAAAYQILRDYGHAIADYTRLLRISPRDIDTLTNRAGVYFATRDYERSIADYTAAISFDPKNSSAYFGRGLARGASADYRAAIADYDEAIRLDPHNIFAFLGRGQAYELVKDYAHAAADDSEALRLDPASLDALEARRCTARSPDRLPTRCPIATRRCAGARRRQHARQPRARAPDAGSARCRDRGLRRGAESRAEARELALRARARPAPQG